MTAPAQAKTTSKGRTYLWGGVDYVSVTTVLSAAIPKPFLVPWAAKSVAEAAAEMIFDKESSFDKIRKMFGSKVALISHLKGAPYRYRDHKADLGSQTHAWVEAVTLGQPLPAEAPLEIRGYLKAFGDFVRDWKPEFEASEATVYSVTYGYAGTFDWIAYITIDGKRTLVLGDWKTSKGVYGDYALQMAAYAHADFIGLPGGIEAPLPPVERSIVVHLEPNGTYACWEMDISDATHRKFLDALNASTWVKDTDSLIKELPKPTALAYVGPPDYTKVLADLEALSAGRVPA